MTIQSTAQDATARENGLPRPVFWLAALSLIAATGALIAADATLRTGFWAGAAGLFLMGAGVLVGARRGPRAAPDGDPAEAACRVIEHDPAPGFLTDAKGTIDRQNHAAIERFGDKPGAALVAVLGDVLASVDVLHRLRSRASDLGSAREDIAGRRGQMRLSAARVGPNAFLWRLEDMAERLAARAGDGVGLPMLTVSRQGTVLFMNDPMRRLIGGRETALDRIVADLPIRSGEVHMVDGIEGRMPARVIEVVSAAGRRELYFMPAGGVAGAADWRLLDILPVPLLRLMPDGVIEAANAAAEALVMSGPLRGRNLADLVLGLGRPVDEWPSDAASSRGGVRSEVVQLSGGPGDRYLQVTVSPLEGAEALSLIAVLHDATELKTLEAQFVQSQKMQAIGQLAGGVAHDFNNLLTAISGHCDLLMLAREPGDPDYADLDQINQNAARAAGLVSQLLAFSRKQTMRPTLIDMRETLDELSHLLNRLVGETIELTVRHDASLARVRADKRQIEQVIMNLVVNARDAMPGGGRIELVTENRRLTAPLQRDRAEIPAGPYVEITVRDEGTGIPPESIGKIFEPFYTTKRTGEGTGLGLSTAYGIVKQSGGFIFAESVEGEGASFTILLPAHEAPLTLEPPMQQGASAAKATTPTPPAGDGVVLLVEDEAPVRAFASRALRLRGYDVIEAASAEEALDRLRDPDLGVDVFVTDVIMPGLDGPSWVAEALRNRPDTAVVFVSGYAEETLSRSQAQIPNSVFLAKPFSLDDLTATVHGQMARGTARLPAE